MLIKRIINNLLIRYIHRNSLKSGLVKRLDQHFWSSHKGYLSKAKKWNWLYKHFVLQMLTVQYKKFMAQEQDEDLVRILDGKNRPSMLGSDKFISLHKTRNLKTALNILKTTA